MQLYRLNVSRSIAGRDVPFDRVYIAHGEARKAVKALFDYALVLPLTEGLREQVIAAQPSLHRSSPLAGRNTPWEPIPGGANNWKETITRPADWILVVPILPRLAKQAMPGYLLNKRWYTMSRTRKNREQESPLPSMAYLQTPTENFRPACIACPRFSEHQAGMCQLGQRICYETLVLGDLPRQAELEDPTDIRDLQETEVEE